MPLPRSSDIQDGMNTPRLTAAERDEFDRLLEEIFTELPEMVHDLLEEVPVIVEDEPTIEIQKEMDAYVPGEPSDLCGLHWGVPLPEQSVMDPARDVPVIKLFRGPIYRLAGASKRQLRRQIRITLLHEIGHHFGFSEEKLEEMGYG